MYNVYEKSMFEYLYENKKCPFKYQNYQFMILTSKSTRDYLDTDKIIEVFKEIFNDIYIATIDKKIVIFYFDDLGISMKDIILSISDDIGTTIKCFNSSKLDSSNSSNFLKVFDLYIKFMDQKTYIYSDTSDLVLEIVKEDINFLKDLKQTLLNKIYQDSQLEKLILTMFDNNLNVTKTAKSMYMHRNTINNKLELIKNETGLNIQNFKDAIAMYWIIKTK